MKYLILLLTLFPSSVFCQNKHYEIFGRINGDYKGKIYLFFNANYRQRDSISSEIKNNEFHFSGNIDGPILGRLHLDGNSLIEDFYLENGKVNIQCKAFIRKTLHQDTMNMLKILDVRGSQTEALKRQFGLFSDKLATDNKSEEEKREIYFKKLFQFVNKYPKKKVSAYLIGNSANLMFNQVCKLYALLDTSLRNSFEEKKVKTLLESLDKSKFSEEGIKFYDVSLKDTSGMTISTAQFRSKYTLILFWASWCKPCREEHPDLNALYEKYKNNYLEIIGISLDNEKKRWTKAIVDDKTRWIQISELKGFESDIARHYGIESIPFNFLIDKDGKIVKKNIEPREIEAMFNKMF